MTDYGLSLNESRYLGKLCPHGHDWSNTGKSIRYHTNQTCIPCMRVGRSGRAQLLARDPRRDLLPGKWYSQADLDRFWDHVTKTDYCWTASGWNVQGYPMLRVQGKDYRMNRLSWEIHNGPINGGLYVCHACDNRACIRPDHLWLGSQAENMTDRDRKGRTAHSGPRNISYERLSVQQVLDIRRLSRAGTGTAQLCRLFNRPKPTILGVVKRRTYKNVA